MRNHCRGPIHLYQSFNWRLLNKLCVCGCQGRLLKIQNHSLFHNNFDSKYLRNDEQISNLISRTHLFTPFHSLRSFSPPPRNLIGVCVQNK
jgi:hypothetical protein